jgi:hypothetical protein
MRHLEPGQEVVLASADAAIDGRVIAVAGRYVLIHRDHGPDVEQDDAWSNATLTYLEGLLPMTCDGSVYPGARPEEVRFFTAYGTPVVERRGDVRVPVASSIALSTHSGSTLHGQLIDLSAGGLRMRHSGRLMRGIQVRVRVELPNLVIDADAVTHRVELGGTTLRFTRFHAGSSPQISEWAVALLRSHVAGSRVSGGL